HLVQARARSHPLTQGARRDRPPSRLAAHRARGINETSSFGIRDPGCGGRGRGIMRKIRAAVAARFSLSPGPMTGLLQDLRYAARGLLRASLFTAVAVATLALGTGLNTAIFGVVEAVLLQPMPGVRQPDRLLWISAARHGRARPLSYPDFLDIR